MSTASFALQISDSISECKTSIIISKYITGYDSNYITERSVR